MKCNHCGTENLDKAKFCKICGKMLQNVSDPLQSDSKEQMNGAAQEKQMDYQAREFFEEQGNFRQSYPANPGSFSQFTQHQNPQMNPQFQQRQNLQMNPQAASSSVRTINAGEKKKSRSKSAVFLTIAITAAIIAGVVFFVLPQFSSGGNNKSNAKAPQYTWTFPYDEKKERSYIVMNADLSDDKIDGGIRNQIASQDGSVVAVSTSEDVLYYITPTDIVEIEDHFNADDSSFAMSSYNNKIAYVDDDYVLMIYSVDDEKSEEIADDVVPGSVVISQDGGSVAYAVFEDKKEIRGDSELFVWKDGIVESVGENLACVSVSDNAKYIYSYSIEEYDENATLYFSTYGEKIKRVSSNLVFSYSNFLLNETQSEIIFQSGEKIYISIEGDKPIRINGSGMMYPILPVDEPWISISSVASGVFRPTLLGGVYVFYDYYGNYSMEISYIDKKGDVESIEKRVDGDIQLCANGDTVFYIKNEKLYKNSIKNPKAEQLAKRVSSFAILPDGKSFYYVDTKDVLWYQSGNNDPQEIMDDVRDIQLNRNDDTLFIEADYDNATYLSTLYSCRNGEDPERIAKKVYSFQILNNVNQYYVKDSKERFELFVSPGNTEFESICSDLENPY